VAALIGTQIAPTAWAGRHSPLVLLTAAGSFMVLVAVVQTRGRDAAGPARHGRGRAAARPPPQTARTTGTIVGPAR
jgi:hypothetical protein